MEESKYSVKLTPLANQDLNDIYSYIFRDLSARDAANNILDSIETKVMQLKYFPYANSFVRDEFLKNKGYRRIIIDNCVAFYLVDEVDKQVVVMRILYGRQKYEDIL